MNDILRVGVIGASAQRGWAKISHVPAIRQVDGLELGAVVTRDRASAIEAAEAFGAAKGYGDAASLFADRDIDIVTVSVNVPDHRALVLGALAAGKHVFCEYPLGRDVAESRLLAGAAREAGVHHAVGLQLRANSSVMKARELIEAGAIGRVLNARVLSTTAAFGPETEAAMAFSEDARNGVTLPTIQGAHTLDLVIAVLGGFAGASASSTTQFPHVRIDGANEPSPHARTTSDYLSVMATSKIGAPVSIVVVGGAPPDRTPFRFTITGETGTIVLEGGALRGVQSGTLRLLLDGEEQKSSGPVATPDTAVNVAGLYVRLRDDILDGTHRAPDFDHGVRVSRLLADVLEAAETGSRASAAGWPES